MRETVVLVGVLACLVVVLLYLLVSADAASGYAVQQANFERDQARAESAALENEMAHMRPTMTCPQYVIHC